MNPHPLLEKVEQNIISTFRKILKCFAPLFLKVDIYESRISSV